MAKVNNYSLKYKMQKEPNKTEKGKAENCGKSEEKETKIKAEISRRNYTK